MNLFFDKKSASERIPGRVGWLVVLGFAALSDSISVYIGPSPRERERTEELFGWLFWVKRPFETIFEYISGRVPKRGRKRRKDG